MSVAQQFGIADWKEATRKSDWVKARLGSAIRGQVAQYAESEVEIEEEILALYE